MFVGDEKNGRPGSWGLTTETQESNQDRRPKGSSAGAIGDDLQYSISDGCCHEQMPRSGQVYYSGSTTTLLQMKIMKKKKKIDWRREKRGERGVKRQKLI